MGNPNKAQEIAENNRINSQETSNKDLKMSAFQATPILLRDLAKEKQGLLGELPNNPNNDDIIVGYFLDKPVLDN